MLSRSVVSDSVTPWTVACKTSLSMGIRQARIQEWVAMHSSRGSSQPRDRIQVSHIAGILYRLSYQRHVHTCTHAHTHRADLVAQMVKNLPARLETWVQSLGWEDPLEEGVATYSGILAWRIPMDRGAWWAPVHGVAKSWTPLSNQAHMYTDTLTVQISRFAVKSSHWHHGKCGWSLQNR